MKLFRLECQKVNFRPYLFSVAAIATFLLGMMYLIGFLSTQTLIKVPGAPQFKTVDDLFMLISITAAVIFGVLAAVLFSKIVIEPYGSRQVQLLFSYPVKRSRIFWLKIGLVYGFITMTLFASLSVSLGVFYITEQISPLLTSNTIHMGAIFSQSFLALCVAIAISSISLSIAFKKKSVQLTIVLSIIFAAIISNVLQLNDTFLNLGAAVVLIVGTIFSLMHVLRQVKVMEAG